MLSKKRSKETFIGILMVILLFSNINLSSFPGDHNSLTCTEKLIVTSDATYTEKKDIADGYLDLDPEFVDYTIQKYLRLRQITIDAIGERQ